MKNCGLVLCGLLLLSSCASAAAPAPPVVAPEPACPVAPVRVTSAPVPTPRPPPDTPPAAAPPSPPARFPERRADEALDRLAELVNMRSMTRGRVITLSSDDLFDPGSCTLERGTVHGLDDVATALAQQGERRVRVEVFTDSLDPALNDKEIARCRADAILRYLVGHHVDASKITALGRGSDDPVADNSTASGRAQNRRVEIEVLGNAAPEDATGAPR